MSWEQLELFGASCKCTLVQRLVGDGCAVCNPELAAELAIPDADWPHPDGFAGGLMGED